MQERQSWQTPSPISPGSGGEEDVQGMGLWEQELSTPWLSLLRASLLRICYLQGVTSGLLSLNNTSLTLGGH